MKDKINDLRQRLPHFQFLECKTSLGYDGIEATDPNGTMRIVMNEAHTDDQVPFTDFEFIMSRPTGVSGESIQFTFFDTPLDAESLDRALKSLEEVGNAIQKTLPKIKTLKYL